MNNNRRLRVTIVAVCKKDPLINKKNKQANKHAFLHSNQVQEFVLLIINIFWDLFTNREIQVLETEYLTIS